MVTETNIGFSYECQGASETGLWPEIYFQPLLKETTMHRLESKSPRPWSVEVEAVDRRRVRGFILHDGQRVRPFEAKTDYWSSYFIVNGARFKVSQPLAEDLRMSPWRELTCTFCPRCRDHRKCAGKGKLGRCDLGVLDGPLCRDTTPAKK